MRTGKRCRNCTGGTGVSQRCSIADGDGRGDAVTEAAKSCCRHAAETERAAVDEYGSSESVGARAGRTKDEGSGARLDEVRHGGRHSRVVRNPRVHGDRAGGVLMEYQVAGGARVRRLQSTGRAVDIPVICTVDEDGAWGRCRASAQGHTEGNKIKRLLGSGRRAKLQGADGGNRCGLVLTDRQIVGRGVGTSAGNGKRRVSGEPRGVSIGGSIRRPVESVCRAVAEHEAIVQREGGISGAHLQGRARRRIDDQDRPTGGCGRHRADLQSCA